MYKTCLFLLSFISFFSISKSQSIQVIEYDMNTKQIDTINIDINTNKPDEKTSFFVGHLNNTIANLNENTPTEHLAEGSLYTLKFLADEHYTTSDFPIRTSVRLNHISKDSLQSFCSGSLVGPNLVLTAAHCISSSFGSEFTFYEGNYFATPIYNNGSVSNQLYGGRISKILVPIIDQKIYDIAMLVLDDPIGISAGWLGIGYQEQDESLLSHIYYKFSYPAKSNFLGNGILYNGDTLFFNYGKLDYISERHIGVNYGKGIPGESGSSLFSVKFNKDYTSYGVFSIHAKYSHTRITKPIYLAFKHYIQRIELPVKKEGFLFFPNPVTNNIFLYSVSKSKFNSINILNLQGKLMFTSKTYNDQNGINLDFLSTGIYLIECKIDGESFVKKMIKL